MSKRIHAYTIAEIYGTSPIRFSVATLLVALGILTRVWTRGLKGSVMFTIMTFNSISTPVSIVVRPFATIVRVASSAFARLHGAFFAFRFDRECRGIDESKNYKHKNCARENRLHVTASW